MSFRLLIHRKLSPTYALLIVNIVVYGFTSFYGGSILETSQQMIENFGQLNRAMLEGQIWRLFTALFIHANIVHMLGNSFFLLIFGLRAESMFSTKEYLFTYFLSGFVGGSLSLLLGPNVVSVGASGAIFGMLGATMIYVRRTIGQSMLAALAYAFFFFVITSFGPGVNYYAHLGGLAAGLLIGYAFATTRKQKQTPTYEYTYSYYTRLQRPCPSIAHASSAKFISKLKGESILQS